MDALSAITRDQMRVVQMLVDGRRHIRLAVSIVMHEGSIAAMLKDHTRPENEIARFGGEEFAVLIAHVDADSVLSVAERIRRTVPAYDLGYDGHDGATGLKTGEAPDAFLKRADVLLNGAKDDAETGLARISMMNRILQLWGEATPQRLRCFH